MGQAWLTYHCRVREADVASIETCLEQAGALALSCTPADAAPIRVDKLDGESPLWPVCDVSGLFELDADVAAIESLFSTHGLLPISIWTTTLPAQNWQDSWRDQFPARCYGQRLWVSPSWLTPPSASDLVVLIDPGMAFGTGNHATTALCLEWLTLDPLVGDANVLDFGCGSGILAIAAAKLGARKVTAVDIDRAARVVCAANCERNEIACDIHAVEQASFSAQRYDLIAANILLEPLCDLVSRFAALLVPGGRVVLSGILEEQINDLVAAYEQKFSLEAPHQRDGWALIAGTLKPE